MIVARYWKKTKGEFETDFYKSKEQGRAGKFLINSLQAINVLPHLQNVTTVGVENYIIQLQWTCHYNPQGTPERTEKIDEPFSFYINTNIKQ